MKKNILLLAILITQNIFSQNQTDTLHNFKVEDNVLIWQKVFETNLKEKEKTFITKIITHFKYNNLQEIDNIISFSVSDDTIDYKKYGGKWGTTAIFVQYPNNYLVVVDFKESKYRITIKNINLSSNNRNLATNLEDYVLRNNQIKNSKTFNKALDYYNKHFTEKFTITTKKDDW